MQDLHDEVANRLTELKLDYRLPEVAVFVHELMFRQLLIVWDTDSGVTKSLAFAGLMYRNPLTVWTKATGFSNTEATDV